MEDKGVRKFRIALVAMGLISSGFVSCHFSPALAVVYGEYCMAVLGAASVFTGANVLEKLRKPA
jgi:hypothetical protein